MAVAATKIASGTSASATTTCNFTAQPAGTWLVLHVSCDDYRTTSGSGRPESTSWTLRATGQDEIGFYVWTKVAAGSETSVQYTIGSGSPSAWEVIAVTGAADTLANTPTATHTHGGSTTTSGSVTPPAGAFVLACLSAYHSTTAITGASWSNSYTQVGFQGGITSGNRETVASASLSPASGAATSTTASWTGTSQLCSYGTALVFTEGSGSGGTTYDVTGTVAATSSTTGDVSRLTRTLAVAGTIAALSTVSGDVTRVPVVQQVSGTVTATSSTSGDVARVGATQSVSGTVAAVSGTAGDVTRPTRTLTVTGAAAAVSGSSGDVSRLGSTPTVSGTVAAVSDTQGAVSAILAVTGTVAASSSSSGDVTRPPHTLTVSGTVAAVSGAGGSVSVVGGPQTYPVTGTAAAVSSSSGAAPTVRAAVAGTVAATSSTTGDVDVLRAPVVWQVAGTIPATSDTLGAVVLIAQASGTVEAVSGTSGDVITRSPDDSTADPNAHLTLTVGPTLTLDPAPGLLTLNPGPRLELT